MTTKQILSLALLATALTLNAASSKDITLNIIQQSNSVSTTIANILYEKGIEKKNALAIVSASIDENEKLFSIMLNNYISTISVNHNDVLNSLAQLALNSKKADLSSYSFLIKLTNHVNKTTPNNKILDKLDKISTSNSLLKGIFA